jgi:hypothetical protein
MRMLTRRVVGLAQVSLSVLFVGGYFYTLWEFIHGKVKAGVEWHDAIQTLLSLLTAGVLQILHFWYSRSRPQDHPTEHTDGE